MELTKKPQEALTVGASGNLRASTAVGGEADQMGSKGPPEGMPGPPAHLVPLTTLEHSFDIQSFTQEQIWLPLQGLQEVELVSSAPASSKDHPPTHLPSQIPTLHTTYKGCPKQPPNHLQGAQITPESSRSGEKQRSNQGVLYPCMYT